MAMIVSATTLSPPLPRPWSGVAWCPRIQVLNFRTSWRACYERESMSRISILLLLMQHQRLGLVAWVTVSYHYEERECNLELVLWHDQLPLGSLSSRCFWLSFYENAYAVYAVYKMRMLCTSRYICFVSVQYHSTVWLCHIFCWLCELSNLCCL
jgi:hypothetical protein